MGVSINYVNQQRRREGQPNVNDIHNLMWETCQRKGSKIFKIISTQFMDAPLTFQYFTSTAPITCLKNQKIGIQILNRRMQHINQVSTLSYQIIMVLFFQFIVFFTSQTFNNLSYTELSKYTITLKSFLSFQINSCKQIDR